MDAPFLSIWNDQVLILTDDVMVCPCQEKSSAVSLCGLLNGAILDLLGLAWVSKLTGVAFRVNSGSRSLCVILTMKGEEDTRGLLVQQPGLL